jgi:hypothetical protein
MTSDLALLRAGTSDAQPACMSSFFDTILDPVVEVGSLGVEALEAVGEATPIVGTAINGGKAIYHSSKAHDAEMAGDTDAADMYGSKASYDWLKAIPGVGTVLGLGELANGLHNAVDTSDSRHSAPERFASGMENFSDGVQDAGAMLGIDEFSGKGHHDSWGSHTELRENVEERERLEEYARAHGGGAE